MLIVRPGNVLMPHLAQEPGLWLLIVQALAPGRVHGVAAPLLVHEAVEDGPGHLRFILGLAGYLGRIALLYLKRGRDMTASHRQVREGRILKGAEKKAKRREEKT